MLRLDLKLVHIEIEYIAGNRLAERNILITPHGPVFLYCSIIIFFVGVIEYNLVIEFLRAQRLA